MKEYLCVIEYFFPEAPGGSGRVAWDVAMAMRDKGYSVTMLFYQKEGAEEGISNFDGVRLVRFKKQQKPAWHPARLQAIINSTSDACQKYLADRNWDIVHIHTPLMGKGVVDSLQGNPRYVVTVHSPIVMEQEIIWGNQGLIGKMKLFLGRKLLKTNEEKLLQAADKIQTLSRFTLDIIDNLYGVGNKVTVIPHWYEQRSIMKKEAARKVLGWPEDSVIFFTVRGLGPRYGVDVAIRALAPLLKGTDSRFYIGGRGLLRQMLEDLVVELGVTENIHFLGRLSDEDLEASYAAADMFILPTLALECYGLISVEAMSYGCPVISSDAGAIPEIMQAILPNCIVPASNVDALHDKASQFLEGQLKIPDGDALKSHVLENYSKDLVVSGLIDLFEH